MKGKEIIFALSILALPAPTLAGTPKMMVEAQTSTTIRQIIDGGINQRFATLVTDVSAESVATLNLLNFVIDIRVRC